MLRSLRLSPRFFYQFLDRVQQPEAGFGRATWVLARALCQFKRLDLGQVPRSARAQALLLQIPQFSPFPSTGHYAAWQDGSALVWYWDKDKLLRSMAEAGLVPQRVRVWPESVLYAPATSGLRLVRNLNGVEGQWWQDGRLLQCRWWNAPPDAREWLNFQRDLGLAIEAREFEVPQIQVLALQSIPTLRYAASSGLAAGWSDERLAYALGILVLFMPTAWIGAGMLKTKIALQAVHATASTVAAKAQPLLDARNQALQIAARNQTLAQLDTYLDQLDLMARVASALPKGGAYLKEWDFRDGKLKVVLVTQGNTLSSSALVSALQLAGGFDNVQIAPGNDPKVTVINMNIVRAHAPARG